MFKRIQLLLLGLLSFFSYGFSQQTADLVVYGGTPGGIASAVQAARGGVKVILVEEQYQVGGMLTGGLAYIDFRTFEAVQGFFREYMNGVHQYYSTRYGANSKQVADSYHGLQAEPHVALYVFDSLLRSAGVRVFTNFRLQKAHVRPVGGKPTLYAADFKNTKGPQSMLLQAKVFIDATYEGDLMAAAGCSYRLGRESRETYGEIFAGKVFVKDGRILLGSTGEGDRAIQGYNFRVCMTDSAENGLPIPKPENYDRSIYLPLLRAIQSGQITAVSDQILKLRSIPNRKYDVNDKHLANSISLARPGWSWDWPEGNESKRKEIFKRHLEYTLGFFFFLQNDEAIPEKIRNEAKTLWLPKDEFEENNHFTPSIYVREGRRLSGVMTFIEKDCQQAPNTVRGYLRKDAVAVGDYGLNSHGCDEPSRYHPGIRDGAFSYATSNLPYQIPYGVMVPEKMEGLLVPVALSSSHVGFSALRYEVIWTSLGQAAGIAAVTSVKQRTALRRVAVEGIQQQLHAAGGITVYFSDVKPSDPWFRVFQYFGTLGYFHDVPQWGSVPFEDHLKFIGDHQYTPAFPYHAAMPLEKVDERLARMWLEKAGQQNHPVLSQKYSGMTRAAFLTELYKLVYREPYSIN
ncbi:FAD-dependent oxidoreductase [Flavihumibacter sp. RY-1]|uniref:FAD-dependent oxidoreductase n=1 Tax=Flavihumibacter fluminis TaxID=2909236 RepID=A0ABS9BGA8_9BACT|nr:FAD-dependent oxidoreductase [Flavihumibacter fluminis]MCF1713696.1 FAD-dependent oxidoreductase [Flavihumibacter fluminis]